MQVPYREDSGVTQPQIRLKRRAQVEKKNRIWAGEGKRETPVPEGEYMTDEAMAYDRGFQTILDPRRLKSLMHPWP